MNLLLHAILCLAGEVSLNMNHSSMKY